MRYKVDAGPMIHERVISILTTAVTRPTLCEKATSWIGIRCNHASLEKFLNQHVLNYTLYNTVLLLIYKRLYSPFKPTKNISLTDYLYVRPLDSGVTSLYTD